MLTWISIVLWGLAIGESGAKDGIWCDDAKDMSSPSAVSSCGDEAVGVLDADMPPDDAWEAIATVEEEKLRNMANIESALEIFGVLKSVMNVEIPAEQ